MLRLKTAAAFGCTITAFIAGLCFFGALSAVAFSEKDKVRAVSLGVLEKQICSTRGPLSPALTELAGLKEIWGYVIDPENKDIILYGPITPDSTNRLFTEDLVIAFQNAWMKYADRDEDTYIYAHPGCSIDPQTNTMIKLARIGQAVNSGQDHSGVENQLNQWRQVCQEWQQVRVLGIPFNSRFAATMVKADYDMKLLVDGTDVLNVPGFHSLIGIKTNLVRNALATNKRISFSLAGMNRFWFYPGRNEYEEDDGIVWIKRCPVVLLTEEMAVGKKGYGSAGSVDPLAQKFTEEFSALYNRIAEVRPIYAELEHLFRIVALAKIIHFKELPKTVGLNLEPTLKNGLDLTCLLEHFPIQTVSVAKQLAGRSAIEEIKYEEELGQQRRIYQLWLQSCGGVGIDIEITKDDFVPPSAQLRRLRRSILAARPSPNALFWDLPTDDDSALEIGTAVGLTALNARDRWHSTVAVRRRKSDYRLFTERGRIYEGNSISGLLIGLHASGALNGKQVTVQIAGFDAASDGLSEVLRSELRRNLPELAVSVVNPDSSEAGVLPGAPAWLTELTDRYRQLVAAPAQNLERNLIGTKLGDLTIEDVHRSYTPVRAFRVVGPGGAGSILKVRSLTPEAEREARLNLSLASQLFEKRLSVARPLAVVNEEKLIIHDGCIITRESVAPGESMFENKKLGKTEMDAYTKLAFDLFAKGQISDEIAVKRAITTQAEMLEKFLERNNRARALHGALKNVSSQRERLRQVGDQADVFHDKFEALLKVLFTGQELKQSGLVHDNNLRNFFVQGRTVTTFDFGGDYMGNAGNVFSEVMRGRLTHLASAPDANSFRSSFADIQKIYSEVARQGQSLTADELREILRCMILTPYVHSSADSKLFQNELKAEFGLLNEGDVDEGFLQALGKAENQKTIDQKLLRYEGSYLQHMKQMKWTLELLLERTAEDRERSVIQEFLQVLDAVIKTKARLVLLPLDAAQRGCFV